MSWAINLAAEPSPELYNYSNTDLAPGQKAILVDEAGNVILDESGNQIQATE